MSKAYILRINGLEKKLDDVEDMVKNLRDTSLPFTTYEVYKQVKRCRRTVKEARLFAFSLEREATLTQVEEVVKLIEQELIFASLNGR